MKRVGLTGGIGSGKSVVSRLFGLYGIPVYDSDLRSKELCVTNTDLIQGLRQLFGDEVYFQDGTLNRTHMASLLFNNKNLLEKSNALIHPAVEKDVQHWLKMQNAPFAIQETAILFEAGLRKHFDAVICVTAPENIRIERVCKRNGVSPEQVQQRLNNQLAEAERIRQSDYILINDDLHALIPQVEELIIKLSHL